MAAAGEYNPRKVKYIVASWKLEKRPLIFSLRAVSSQDTIIPHVASSARTRVGEITAWPGLVNSHAGNHYRSIIPVYRCSVRERDGTSQSMRTDARDDLRVCVSVRLASVLAVALPTIKCTRITDERARLQS